MTNFWIIVSAIVTANIISFVLEALAMSNGGVVKWFTNRYYKMFDELWDEEL